jgi:hypothetical protein
MPVQLALAFDAVPGACEVQKRYHSIAPCLAGVATPAEQAQALNLGYSTVTRWLREFREEGMRPIKTWVAYLADQLWNPSTIFNTVDETRSKALSFEPPFLALTLNAPLSGHRLYLKPCCGECHSPKTRSHSNKTQKGFSKTEAPNLTDKGRRL